MLSLDEITRHRGHGIHGRLTPRKPSIHSLPKVRSRAAMEFMLMTENNSESDS